MLFGRVENRPSWVILYVSRIKNQCDYCRFVEILYICSPKYSIINIIRCRSQKTTKQQKNSTFSKKNTKNICRIQEKAVPLHSQFGNHSSLALRKKFWRDVRVVECAGLENRCTERYRGFESLSLRKTRYFLASFLFYAQFYSQKLTPHRVSNTIKIAVNS